VFPYAKLPTLEEAKQTNIGVIKGINIKLSHHRGFVPTYLVKNEMSIIHHNVKWHGCDCIIKNDESLYVKTWGHLMLKPEP
jgi:hypothetical protein